MLDVSIIASVSFQQQTSNKGTVGMESSVVLFKPRIHLFACTHPSVSNSLDCNDWLAYKHLSTARVSNMFRLWILVCAHASVSSLVQTRLIMVACLRRSTETGSARWFPLSHEHLGATASADAGRDGEVGDGDDRGGEGG